MKKKDNNKAQRKTLALALGGGAALGFAHIGFLQILEENNIKVNAIAGTSMGSVIGAFYAYGYSAKEIEKIAEEKILLRQFFTDINPLAFFATGAVTGKRIQSVFDTYLDHMTIEELKIPYVAVAVDIMTGKPEYLKTGNVSEAIRTSISVPGVFMPIKKGDMLLVDGGLIDNVPADVAKEFKMDIIISVDVLGDYKLDKEPKNIVSILMSSFGLIQREYEKCKPNVADLQIKITLDGVETTSFNKTAIKKAVKIGREYGEKHLEEIKKLLF